MKLISLKCPNCGADINLDAGNNMEFGFCQYCGTKVMKDIKEIKVSGTVKGNVNIDNEVTVKGIVTPENLIIKAKRQYNVEHKTEEAKQTLDRVLELDPYNKEALKMLKQIRNKELLSYTILGIILVIVGLMFIFEYYI